MGLSNHQLKLDNQKIFVDALNEYLDQQWHRRQEDFAKELGISPSYLTEIKKGSAFGSQRIRDKIAIKMGFHDYDDAIDKLKKKKENIQQTNKSNQDDEIKPISELALRKEFWSACTECRKKMDEDRDKWEKKCSDKDDEINRLHNQLIELTAQVSRLIELTTKN